jgi:hypothetical protein
MPILRGYRIYEVYSSSIIRLILLLIQKAINLAIR